MGFVQPAALLLCLPLAWLFWRTRPPEIAARVLRAVVLLLFVGSLAGAFLPVGRPGRDLVIVVDRSRSMPQDGSERALEFVRLAESARSTGDRLGIVSFGTSAVVDQPPLEEGAFAGFQLEVDPDGSDLAGAIELALGLVPEGRPGALLVLSDGAATTEVPAGLAQRALAKGIPIDVRAVQREAAADLAIERIELPEVVGEGEPFQFSVWVRANRAVRREFRLVRENRVLSSGERSFEPGLNRLVFRDVLERGGVAEYAVEVDTAGDTTPENNRGVGAVFAQGPPRVLLIGEDGRASTLAQALSARGVLLDVRAPEEVVVTPLLLTGFRAVILENVDAGRIGLPGLEALADFVRERGGGLLVTGGLASFGRGGYHRSPIDELLPVSMELRQEHRKQSVALSIVMDRSGSMSMPVDGTRSKMDLANAGAAAAIETLGPMDSVSVIVVDQNAHIVQAQTELSDPSALLSKVRRIESMGGGIYVYNALVAAIGQLANEERLTKHVILFADASDSEQQEGCLQLLAEARGGGVTCSVIALGAPNDPDAAFLRAAAGAGGGSVTFSTSPVDLPRLFAQETLTIARANFVEEPTETRAQAGLLGLGDLPGGRFPNLGGYNLTYLRPEATVAVVTTDEFAAPVLAFAYRGLGRAAAYTGQIGGKYGAPLVVWDEFAGFSAGLVRWLLGTEEPGGIFASVVRDGSRARFVLELDPDAPVPAQLGRLSANARLPDGSSTQLQFERVDASTFVARLDLNETGTVIATVALPDGTSFALPPVSLPHSPEFAHRSAIDPGRVLNELALGSGGRVLASAAELFVGARGDLGSRPVHRELLLAALVLVVLEIAMRRLGLWSFVRLPRRQRTAPRGAPEATTRATTRTDAPATPRTEAAAEVREPTGAPAAQSGLDEAMALARSRAKGRLGRNDGGDA